jgi:hypothetical protein
MWKYGLGAEETTDIEVSQHEYFPGHSQRNLALDV